MKVAIGTVVVVGAMLVSGPLVRGAAAQTTTTRPADSTLDERIEKRIHDSTLKKYDIDVTVDNGVAKLTGTVATEADRRRAAQMATIPGVARVDNQLVVDMSAGKKGVVKGTAGTVATKTKEGAEKTKEGTEKVWDKTKEGAAKAGSATKDGAVKVGEKTKEGLSKTGEVITDGWITTRVKSKFIGEDLLKDSDISVSTDNHVVTLRGTVMSAAGRARAIEQAKEVEGVKSVTDHLTIGPKK